MGDYISRDEALSCFHNWIDKHGDIHTADEMPEYDAIADLPAADVVEAVRCKDCKYFESERREAYTPYGFYDPYYVMWCDKHYDEDGEYFEVMLDDFCSRGERREDV